LATHNNFFFRHAGADKITVFGYQTFVGEE